LLYGGKGLLCAECVKTSLLNQLSAKITRRR